MPTLRDLFKSQKKDLYGKSEAIRIDSRGLLNPPRAAALLLSSPNTIGDLIGGQISGALRGSANRPSDTIFKGKSLLSKPVSLFKTPGQLRNVIEAGTDYYVKPAPSPNSILGTIKQGASSPLGAALELGTDLIKGLKDKNPTRGLPYGQKFQATVGGKDIKQTTTFHTHYTQYNDNKEPLVKTIGTIVEREGSQKISWDGANIWAQGIESLKKLKDDEKKGVLGEIFDLDDTLKRYELQNQVWVLFKKYGNREIIPFAGTIGSISETVTPEWTNFRYLGSPFKSYRYLGVERTLSFDLKLYYTTVNEKDKMIKKINYLKSLAFPYEQISQIQYNRNQENPIDAPVYSQYAFSPNLVTLNIGDMYRNLFGYIESLSFSVDDNTTWPNENVNMKQEVSNKLYPSVVTVSIGMHIIEQHKAGQDDGITKYRYNFDGLGMNIMETPEEKQQKADMPNIPSEPDLPTNITTKTDTPKDEVRKKSKKKPHPQESKPKKEIFNYQMPTIKDTIQVLDPTRKINSDIERRALLGLDKPKF